MTKFWKKELPLLQATSTLIGTIIGAGILGIPYVFAKAGFWTGVVVLAVITFAMLAMKLMFGEITLRTYGNHQISGYVEKYLGKFWKNLTSIILILTISGSILAYFIGIGEVLAEIFKGSAFIWGFAFYILASIFLYFGLKLIKNIELIFTGIIFLIVLTILFLSQQHFELGNLANFDFSKLLIPYGVVLFACSGIIAVPEVRKILSRREYLFKKSILLGVLIPSVIYLIFAWIVVGVTGANTTEIATVGLGRIMGYKIIIIGNIFAFFTMATSFLTLGLGLKETFNFDFKIKHVWAWLLTIIMPLVIYASGLKNFIQILGLVGALGFGINGVIYIFTYWVARKKSERHPEYILPKKTTAVISVFLVLIFVGGLIYTIFNNF
ncbi:hypothetical protein L6278_00125 [Candidatus Parcubacteria bacterium]|nr:hypothetical protein [Patescibacteria group bacterium]MCG2686526.1 hypothetical protein [Candidatus Parcubacteria bacterium]